MRYLSNCFSDAHLIGCLPNIGDWRGSGDRLDDSGEAVSDLREPRHGARDSNAGEWWRVLIALDDTLRLRRESVSLSDGSPLRYIRRLGARLRRRF